MSAYLLTGWDTARLGSMKVAYSDPDVVAEVAAVPAGTYAHRDLSGATGSGQYTDVATVLGAALNALGAAGTMTVAFDASSLAYVVSNDSDGFTLDFRSSTLGDSSGKRLAAALGFDYQHPYATGGSAADPYNIALALTPPQAGSYTSNVTPYYALALSKAGPAKYTRPYEVSGQTKRQTSVNGNAYSIGPTTYEKRVKFQLLFQTLASTFASEASATVPWTYEALVQHARCWEPILLSYTAEDVVYKLVRGEFDEESRQSVWQDYHGRWNLAVEGQYLGVL